MKSLFQVAALVVMAAVVGAGLSDAAIAAETITYTYDAKGRLVLVKHSGSVNNGVSTEYKQDGVNNRTTVTVAGAPSK